MIEHSSNVHKVLGSGPRTKVEGLLERQKKKSHSVFIFILVLVSATTFKLSFEKSTTRKFADQQPHFNDCIFILQLFIHANAVIIIFKQSF